MQQARYRYYFRALLNARDALDCVHAECITGQWVACSIYGKHRYPVSFFGERFNRTATEEYPDPLEVYHRVIEELVSSFPELQSMCDEEKRVWLGRCVVEYHEYSCFPQQAKQILQRVRWPEGGIVYRPVDHDAKPYLYCLQLYRLVYDLFAVNNKQFGLFGDVYDEIVDGITW